MNVLRTATILVLSAGLAACDSDSAGPIGDTDQELALALSETGSEVMDRHQAGPGNWHQRLLRAVREQGDEAAAALLEEARILMEEARAAREAGESRETVVALLDEANALVAEAVISVFPGSSSGCGPR